MLPTAGIPSPGYHASVNISLQPRGSRLAVRFDSSVRCGRQTFDIVGRRVAAFDGTHVDAREAIVETLGPGRRLLYAWAVTGTVAGPAASGNLHVVGSYRVRGRRAVACTRQPDRPWQARQTACPDPWSCA